MVEILTKAEMSDSLCTDIIAFISGCESAHLHHFPDWSAFMGDGTAEEYRIAVSRSGGRINGILPYMVRAGKFGKVCNSQPHISYGGALSEETGVAGELTVAVLREARAEGTMSVTVCTSPFGNDGTGSVPPPDYRTENFMQFSIIDQHPLAGVSAKRRGSIRNEIRKARCAGLDIGQCRNEEGFRGWLNIYRRRCRQLGIVGVADRIHEGIFRNFNGNGRAELWTAADGDGTVGGTLFLIGHRIIEYFSSAFHDKVRGINVGSWILDDFFNQTCGAGHRFFNWQSSPVRGGGVWTYKQKWGAQEGSHQYLTWITGDVSRVLASDIAVVREEYPGYFILPFRLWRAHG